LILCDNGIPFVQAKKANNSTALQDRDFALLRGLFESRGMTSGHIAPLISTAVARPPKKRLQKIKAAGLNTERRRLVN
jgi:hypothetical protein